MTKPITVGDVFSKKFSTINLNDSFSKCLDLFKKEVPPVLAVVNDKGRYMGVIARRWIIRAGLAPESTKVKTLMRPAPKVEPSFSLGKAAKLMIQSSVRQLPVFEKNKLLGFITDENIIHGAVTQKWGKTKIKDIMTRAPHTIEASRSVGAVLSLIREQGISHVPVMDSGKLVGIISIQDIIEHVIKPQHRQTKGDIVGEKSPTISIPAKGLMSRPVITVQNESSLKEAEEKMHKYNISCLPVLEQEKLVGIVTKLDFLEPISQTEAPEIKLTLQLAVKDLRINPDEQSFMQEDFDNFSRKYEKTFKTGTVFAYMKTHGTNRKGLPLIHCRLQLRTAKGAFYSSSEGWGIEPAFRVALERLDRRILRSKELAHDPIYAKNYLKKIGFPEQEL